MCTDCFPDSHYVLNSNRRVPSATNPQTGPTFWSLNKSTGLLLKTIKGLRSASAGAILCSHKAHVDTTRVPRSPPPAQKCSIPDSHMLVHMASICLGLPVSYRGLGRFHEHVWFNLFQKHSCFTCLTCLNRRKNSGWGRRKDHRCVVVAQVSCVTLKYCLTMQSCARNIAYYFTHVWV